MTVCDLVGVFPCCCRLPVEAMQALEDKIRSLEQFFRARRNQRRGHYARIFGMGDVSGHGDWHGSPFGADLSLAEHGKSGMGGFETPQVHKARDYQGSAPSSLPKRQRVPYSPSELAAMEVIQLPPG
jgi:nuclear pore complex protein Nup155